MDFQYALTALKEGAKVSRSGWNGKGMYVFLISNWEYTEGKHPHAPYPLLPFLAMKTTGNEVVPWLVSQADVLSEDWSLFDE